MIDNHLQVDFVKSSEFYPTNKQRIFSNFSPNNIFHIWLTCITSSTCNYNFNLNKKKSNNWHENVGNKGKEKEEKKREWEKMF